MEILKNSLFVRFLSKIWLFLKKIWPYSLLCSIGKALKRGYENSKLKRNWESFCQREDPAKFSVYQKFLLKIEKFLQDFGKILKQSLFYNLLCKMKKGYFHLAENSKILGALKKLGLHRLLFLAFAAYLPIEYILRDLLKSGISSWWEEAFILLAALLVLWDACFEENKGHFSRSSSIEVSMLLFMAIGLLLFMFIHPYLYIAIAGYRAQVEYMVWFMLILRLIRNKEDAKFLIYSFLSVIFLLSLHGIYQYIIRVPIPDNWVSTTESAVRTRVFSLCGSPNVFGSLLIFAAPISASLIYYCEKIKHKLFFLCVTGTICLCDLFTFSKGSWVGLVIAVILFAIFVDRRLIALMAVGVSMLLVVFPSITNRIAYLFTAEYTERSNAAGRSMRWARGLDLLKRNNPWLGFGLGRFGGAVAMNNQVIEKTNAFSYFYMDNYYLKTLVEMGIIGLSFYILLLMSFLITGLRSCGKNKISKGEPLSRNIKNDRLLCIGLFCGMTAVLVHCYFENIFEEPYMMAYFWGMAAVLCYL